VAVLPETSAVKFTLRGAEPEDGLGETFTARFAVGRIGFSFIICAAGPPHPTRTKPRNAMRRSLLEFVICISSTFVDFEQLAAQYSWGLGSH